MSTLQELLEKVEGGTTSEMAFLLSPLDDVQSIRAWRAQNGSLDAAKALHEAVLPGWEWEISNEDCGACVHLNSLRSAHLGECRGNPARAWLTAILKALIAEQQETE